MASNVDIESGEGGLIQLTLLSVSENGGPGEPRTAMLTARGKDHDMDAAALEKLGNACLKFAKKIREGK